MSAVLPFLPLRRPRPRRPARGGVPGGACCSGARPCWAWPWCWASWCWRLFAPWIAPQDPIATSWGALRKAPSAEHWFGTDEIGRDVLSRVIWGTRASLLAGVVSVSLSLLIGVPLGLAAGFLGGWVDAVISRITDAFLACPFLILAIALAAFLGPSLTNAMVAIGVSAAPIFVRLTRGQVLA